MEVLSSSSPPCSSRLSFHRLDFAPNLSTRPASKPHTRFPRPSSYFGVSLSHKPANSIESLTFSRNRLGCFHIAAGVFDKFTERAVKAVVFAQREAKALGQDMVFPQHLLLGLITEDHTPGGFLESGITIEVARQAVRSVWNDGEGVFGAMDRLQPTAYLPFSIGSKRVVEAAMEYTREMGHKFVGPEHIVIGLLSLDDVGVARVLNKLGADANHLAHTAVSRLQGELTRDGREPTSSKPTSKKSSFGRKSVTSLDKIKVKSALDRFCVDLTAAARNGLIDPVIGRDIEVQRLIQILCRRTKNNPILLGQAGVGKTAIAEGLASRILEGKVPNLLTMKRVMSLDLGLLISGSKERGELEARITTLIREIKKSGDVILFIDEVHTLIGSGRGDKGSGLGIGDLLKPSLGRGELQCIASTTMDEYRLHFDKDKALARRFQPVVIEEPNQEDAVRILMGLRERYEAHHKCRYTADAIKAAVYLSARYIPDRYLPDKAIDLIDEAGSKARMEASRRKKERQTIVLSKSPNEYWQEIKAVEAMHDVVSASKRYGILDAQETASDDHERSIVGADDIAAVASQRSGVPVQRLTADERAVLLGLDGRLRKRVCGQPEAVGAVCRALRRSRVGLKDPDRPIAVMLFCGPTGVGKTELAKAVAACYFGSEGAMLRLDMSEYMEGHTVSKLIGSPPGYVGYGEGGGLTEAIRRRPFTVVLLDGIEKAHPDVFNLLLQIFEDGHLTDSKGRRVSFKNALVVMTSNVGSTAIARHGSVGFPLAGSRSPPLKWLVAEELKAYFRPELLNRIDEVVVFRSLDKTQMLEILHMMLKEVQDRLVAFGIGLKVSEEVTELICRNGFDRRYGARSLRRTLTLVVEDPLSESILAGEFESGDTAVIELDGSGNPVVRNETNRSSYLSDTQSSAML